MTEAEWNSCADPTPMLEFLRGKASDRKLRLFGAACCRRVWALLTDERSQMAVEAAEQFAEGRLSDVALRRVQNAASAVASGALNKFLSLLHPDSRSGDLLTHTQRPEAAAAGVYSSVCAAAAFAASPMKPFDAAAVQWKVGRALGEAELAAQCRLLRELLGPLLVRPVTLGSAVLAWNDGAVGKLARVIDEERAFDRLPLLADALEEAGCTEPDLLGHCRSRGGHVRGCWAVDLLLGKP